VARLRSTDDAAEASSVVVGMQGVSNAIEFRKSKSGSCSEVAILLLRVREWSWRGEIDGHRKAEKMKRIRWPAQPCFAARVALSRVKYSTSDELQASTRF